MEIIKHGGNLSIDATQSVISIGNYDGVHLGHQYILRKLVSKSRQNLCSSIVITFEPHPKEWFARGGDYKPFLLTNFQEKAALIGKFPIDYLLCFEFNETFATTPPADFVQNILVEKLKAREIIVGYDFNFGRGRSGDANFLRDMGKSRNFKVSVVKGRKVGGEIISSSSIRDLITAGNVKKAADFLGRNYFVAGEVVKGKDMGRKLGFPTANLNVQGKIIPADGVYSVIANVGGKRLCGVANIGTQPTFGNNKRCLETHIINFSGELYGERITLEFVERLRDEKKFQNARELAEQIKMDIKAAEETI